jgi:hypothetical protein
LPIRPIFPSFEQAAREIQQFAAPLSDSSDGGFYTIAGRRLGRISAKVFTLPA